MHPVRAHIAFLSSPFLCLKLERETVRCGKKEEKKKKEKCTFHRGSPFQPRKVRLRLKRLLLDKADGRKMLSF